MTDVTIPADTAKQIAHVLRGARIAYPEWCDYWADLLDSPKPPMSLRDEVVGLLEPILVERYGDTPERANKIAYDILSVVANRLKNLPKYDLYGEIYLLNNDVFEVLSNG